MNEHSYIQSVHRRLPRSLYRWKINDSYQGGVADAYYSGPAGDLWVEYKYIKSLPKRPTSVVDLTNTRLLSTLQQHWLADRHKEGRNVAVVVGSDRGSIILEGTDFQKTLTVETFIRNTVDTNGVALYIQGRTLHLERVNTPPIESADYEIPTNARSKGLSQQAKKYLEFEES